MDNTNNYDEARTLEEEIDAAINAMSKRIRINARVKNMRPFAKSIIRADRFDDEEETEEEED